MFYALFDFMTQELLMWPCGFSLGDVTTNLVTKAKADSLLSTDAEGTLL